MNLLCSHAEVTGKIEEFFQEVPEQVATGVEYVASQVNSTLGFFKYMQGTASGIAMHLADNVKFLEEISKSKHLPECLMYTWDFSSNARSVHSGEALIRRQQ